MAKEVKFTEEELKQVQDIQNKYISIQNQFGQLKLTQINLDNQEIDLEEALKNLQTEEKKFLDLTTEKYGQGTLNPETGVFTPTENKSE
tara:strand:+ start:477 stop:743 length:267 start_codon:yes stop_codon:yes gene_type:complete